MLGAAAGSVSVSAWPATKHGGGGGGGGGLWVAYSLAGLSFCVAGTAGVGGRSQCSHM